MNHYIQCNIKPSDNEDGKLEISDPWYHRRKLPVLQVAGQLDWGIHNDDMYRDVFATNITVLEKCPNKPAVHKPRPIGSGASPDRKLGNACLVAAACSDMKDVMIEAQSLCHGAEGAADIIAIYFQIMLEIDSGKIEERKGIYSTGGSTKIWRYEA